MRLSELIKNHRTWIFLLAIFNIAFHLFFYNTLGFHRDELLYFSLGQHPAAGYASVPPFTGIVAWIVIQTMGYSLFAVRLFPALLSGFYILLGAGITKELGGGKYAQILTTVGMLVPPINLRVFYFFMPVCSDIIFWALFIFFILRWINYKKNQDLIFLGITAGFGMLNKYLILLFIVSIIVSLLFSSDRSLYKNRFFYLALLIAVLIWVPNLIWQYVNNFPVLTHMKALHDSQLVHVDRMAFLTDQFFLGSMSMLLIIPGVFFGFISKGMRKWMTVMAASLMVVLLLVLLRGKSYYTIGLMSLWIAYGAVFWERQLRSITCRVILPFIMIILTIPMVPMGMPVFRPNKLTSYFEGVRRTLGIDMMLRWETGRIHTLPQDYADMLGWDEIAVQTSKAYHQIADKEKAVIYAENYGEAGAVMVLGKQYGLPEPLCFSESFYYWFPRKFPNEITSAIYINSELGSDIQSLFEKCSLVGTVTNPLAREYGVGVWLCTGPKVQFNRFLEERVREVSSPFE